MSTRTIYRGSRRKLVLAFDVGTSYSGISYSVLVPGQVPEIKGVTRFPAHEHISGASKVPTVIYYDRSGKVRAVGAEVMKEGIYEVAEDENWVKAEWFTLHLGSKVGAGRNVGSDLPPLPLDKTAVEVVADFLNYLLECASSYIQDTHTNGLDLWNSVKSHIDFVLSHPNWWEGTQQSEMRLAAVLAGLVPDTASGHSRLSFVTEGEASLHFSVHNGLPAEAMKNGDGVVIVDAGGGTVDISSYSRNQKESFEEIASPQRHFHGSIFVTIHARVYLEAYLRGSPFLDDLDHIVRCFDKTTKLRFRKVKEPQYIKFGSARDNDESRNIRFGQLKLMGSDVAQFFQPSIDCIVKAVLEQRRSAHKTISHVVLVGGFAASDWLFSKVHELLTPHGLNIVRPKNHVNKAISDGAISFWISKLEGPPLKDSYENQYYRTRDELEQTKDKLEQIRDELKQSTAKYDRELRRRDEEFRQASQIIDNLRHDNQRSTDNIRSLQNELFNIRQQFQDAKNLSEVREKELAGFKAFLAEADTLSISEICEKVTALNEEIFQTAATLADALVHKPHEVSQTELDTAYAVSQEMVGEKMTKLLIFQSQKPKPKVNPLLVQVVLQIFIVKFCVSKIQSWYPNDSLLSQFLFTIYSEIRSNEEQAVSGRWRALTLANTRPSTITWNEELYQKLQSVLEIASWAPRSPEYEKSYGSHLSSIFKAINELRLAIGEKFTSADLDIFVFECDHVYDPTIMEVAYGDDRRSSGSKGAPEAIVGTTSIGLAKITIAERSDGAPHFQSLIPAKIVLRSTLKEALEPIQSSTTLEKNKPVENMPVDGANQDGRD